ncbi:Uncharacterized protein Fot_20167 [Forsythia ovata]|uniref:Uncharacterized protein n=1 Tax=Forsythia ovata TaxID=205694 RepID=A0ABD1VNC6_9LAMI
MKFSKPRSKVYEEPGFRKKIQNPSSSKMQLKWRSTYFLNTAIVEDIFGVMESAISVASLKRPEEFMARRWRIARLLYGGNDHGCDIDKEVEEAVVEDKKDQNFHLNICVDHERKPASFERSCQNQEAKLMN